MLAARRVHGSRDYLVAGRSLPLQVNVATVFATWFGAETVLSVSSTFVMDGLGAYWKRANTKGALCAVVFGIGTWSVADAVAAKALIPPNLVGFFASIVGVLLGTLAPQFLAYKGMSIERAIHGARGHGKTAATR